MVNESRKVRIHDEVPQKFSEWVLWRENKQRITELFFFFLFYQSDFDTLAEVDICLFPIIVVDLITAIFLA